MCNKVPKYYYAIAYTVNGVFIYFHDKENSLKKIASSFDDFLDKLHDWFDKYIDTKWLQFCMWYLCFNDQKSK